MIGRPTLLKIFKPIFNNHPGLNNIFKLTDTGIDSLYNLVATTFPRMIRPEPRSLFIAITANCNLRCKGCRYGRDFMSGHQIPWPVIRDLLTDAKELGFEKVRLYGGEPLLHKDLPKMIEHASGLGLNTWVTTNGLLLRDRFDELFAAGLRKITFGFYGVGEDYDRYVQVPGSFQKVEAAIAYAKEHHGMTVSLDWVLMRPTAVPDSLQRTFAFAERYHTPLGVNLIHYSLPYFSMGKDRELQFTPEDRESLKRVAAELVSLKERRPDLILLPRAALHAIPDWLIKGPEMRVPCNSNRLVWVGADGTVQMCYVTFKLGNLHEKRLKDILFLPEHYKAARSAFSLQCPNCHCGFANRTLGYWPARRYYSQL